MPQIDKEKCMACGQCVEACTSEAIDIDVSRKKTGCYLNYVIDQKLCINCGECLKVDCPGGAIHE